MTKKLFFIIGIVFITNILFANTPPTIFNFRTEASEPNRVYFDSDKILTGSNTNGFTVSNKSISGITINEGQLSNHYITVSSSFTFWNNNTIRYEGSSDIKDSNNNPLIEFTLSYIVNNIPEPDANEYRYVNTSASGGGDGKSENSAWTLEEAFDKANAGITVWIKAGNYGNQNLALYNDGTSVSPLKFIGYKNTPGDITQNYYDYGKTWNTNEMPTLTGVSPSKGHAIQLRGVNFVVFKNLQFTNYYHGIRATNSYNSNLVFERLNGKTFGLNLNTHDDKNACFMNFQTLVPASGNGNYRPFTSNNNMKVLNCRSVNASMQGFFIMGDGNNLIEGTKSYNDRVGYYERQDYHIAVNGHNNIIRNCYVENFNNTDTNQSTHGIGIRGNTNLDNDYNLIEKCTAINNQDGLYLRNYGCDNNVIKDSYVGNNGASTYEDRGGVWIMGGSSNNIIERVIVEDVDFGIGFFDNAEEGNITNYTIGSDNMVRNCVVRNTKYAVYVQSQSPGNVYSSLTNTKIINTTFDKSSFFYKNFYSNVQNMEVINCNITNIPNAVARSTNNSTLKGLSFEHSNFWKSWGTPDGNGNINVDPKYVSSIDLRLGESSPKQVTEGGLNLPEVKEDFDKKKRNALYSIGAYEFGDNTTGFINAGPDVEICEGSETILIATGSGSFLWNTGETTASITVSPEESTTYTVTATDGENSASDEVSVTVNEPPSATLGDDINSCLGNEVTLTAVGNGEFLWSTGDTGSSISVTPLETSTYVVTSTIECGSENLSVSDTIVVNINIDLVVTAGVDVTTCSGTEVILTAEGTGDFLWNTGETTESITVNPTETTTYSVTSSDGNCSVSDDVIVTIIEQPEVTLGDDLTICYGSDISLNANGTGDFLWSTGETSPSINVNPLETSEYIVTASVNCGTEVLSVSDTIVVIVSPELTLNISDDVAFCSSQEVTLTADSNGDVIWNTGETTKDIVVSPTETTTYSVTSSLGDCTLTDEVTVTISEQPTVDLGNDVSICSGNEITLTAQGNGAFLWSTGGTKKNIIVSPSETTEYIVTARIDCGSEVLSVTDTIIVNVVPGISLSISDDVSACSGTEVLLTAEGNANFIWNTGETTASITVNPNETTTYSVTSGSGDCALTEEVTVTVEEAPEVTLGDDKTICFGEDITITAEGVGTFLWSTGETTASITVNPVETMTYSVMATTNCGGNEVNVSDEITINVTENNALTVSEDITICSGSEVILTAEGNGGFLWSNGETTSSITISPTETTTYTVTSGSGNCSKSKDILVTVEYLPTLELGEDISICYGDVVYLTAEGIGEFLWNTGETSATIQVNPLVTTTYSVTSTTGCGGVATDDIVVNVGKELIVNAGEDKIICNGESTTLTVEGNGNFLWSTGETADSITVSPNKPTFYSVTIVDGNCSVSDEIFVDVKKAASANLGDNFTICSGDIVTLSVTGHGDYIWSNGATTSSISVSPTQTTTYSIVASSSVCSTDATDEITIFVNESVNANAGIDVSIEPGETITLTATGGNSYLWSNGETTANITVQPENTTTYTVEVGNGTRCNGIDDVTVTVENTPLIINNGEDITICKGDELILQARGSSNYLWNNGETESIITLNPEVSTTYTVSAQKNGILETVDVIVTVEDCSSNRTVNYNVYPNPTEGIVNINIPSQKEGVQLVVSSLNGKIVLKKDVKADENGIFTQINLSRFANGVYFVKMINDNLNETKKVIVF